MTSADAPIPGSRGNRTRNRRLLGIPDAPRFKETPSNLFPQGGEPLDEFYPHDPIDEIIDRYAGQEIPLDEAFPMPPPPPSDHPVLERMARSPHAQHVLAPENPHRQHEIAEEAYRREHQLHLMHKMMVRQGSMAQIASALGMHVSEAFILRKELHRRIGREAGSVDQMSFSGSTIAFYNEVRGNAMRGADTANLDHANKQRYWMVALNAENNKHRFLQVAGFYKDFKLRPKEEEVRVPDDDLTAITSAMRVLFDPELLETEMGEIIDNPRGADIPASDPDDMIRVLG